MEGEHDHDDFETFVVTVPAARDPDALIERLSETTRAHDILRIKGFVEVAGKPMRMLVQGVGQRFRRDFDRLWSADEDRASRLVVIAQKGVDRERSLQRWEPELLPMHIPRIEVRSLDETVEAVDLGQTAADVVFLSFSDSDLNALGRAYRAEPAPKPTLRLASLAALRHPYSIDLYLERVCAEAKLVVARVLGGADYWRYGVDELAALSRRRGIKLALLPGDRRADARLDAASTLRRTQPRRSGAISTRAARRTWRPASPSSPPNSARREKRRKPAPVSAFGRFEAACFEAGARCAACADRVLSLDLSRGRSRADRGACRGACASGFATTSVYVTSLKDDAALAPLARDDCGRDPSTSCSTRPRFPRGSTTPAEPFSISSMRRCCRWCWPAPASRLGALRRAASGPRISP